MKQRTKPYAGRRTPNSDQNGDDKVMMQMRCSWKWLPFVVLVVLFVLIVLYKRITNVHHGSERCHVYSPAYPSLGGGGCSPRCVETGGKKNSSYAAVFYRDHQWPAELTENMERAASILKKYGQPRSLDTREGRNNLHLSFDYYCCYTEEEGIKIGRFLNSYIWRPHEVWFDNIECAIHGYGDMVSFVLMADKKSQQELTQWALQNERDLELSTGVRKHIPHTRLQGFHITLGTVGSGFLVQSAVEEINKVIQPGEWHRYPVVLNRPVCKQCNKLIKAPHSD